ncbi:MAG: DUF3524 domain-containing protein [Thermoanaerobaculia bacterium]|nr:DUF3524 domain-containing protein [Thermoanaerobaculia bacterium]
MHAPRPEGREAGGISEAAQVRFPTRQIAPCGTAGDRPSDRRLEVVSGGGKWLVLEPYLGGSHRALIQGLRKHSGIELEVWSLPPRKWKWRMRGAAVHFARKWREEPPTGCAGILTTSLLDGAALRGLLPPKGRTLPLVVYFHENQLEYPVRVEDERDHHYAWTNLQTALAADRVLWNSAFNRDSFLAAVPGFLDRMPDARPPGVVKAVRGRSRILPVPVETGIFEEARERAGRRSGPARIAWNHRWEHDKAPEVFFRALETLRDDGVEFRLVVLGQQFQRRPRIFEEARKTLSDRIDRWGYVPSREEYARELARSDFVVSTARHEFQGLAVLEAAAAGALPVVPDDLVYPEIWPRELRYPRGELGSTLRERIENLEDWRCRSYEMISERFDWSTLEPRWREAFDPDPW